MTRRINKKPTAIEKILDYFKNNPTLLIDVDMVSKATGVTINTARTNMSVLSTSGFIERTIPKKYIYCEKESKTEEQTVTESPVVEPTPVIITTFEKTHTLPGLNDILYLTGSRFFGCVGNRSDADYFVQDSIENRLYFKERFHNYSHKMEMYVGDTQCNYVMTIHGDDSEYLPSKHIYYDIQFVQDVEFKLSVQDAMFSFFDDNIKHKNTFHLTSKDRTFKTLSRFYWMLAFEMFRLSKIKENLSYTDETYQKLFKNVITGNYLTMEDWFIFAKAMFNAGKEYCK